MLVLAAGVACYAPDPPRGAACADGVCPEGLTCSPATNTCEAHAIDAGSADSSEAPIDVAIDAATMPAIVQQVTNHGDAVATLSATLPATPAAGHLLIMIGANLSGSLASVSGGAVTWTRAASSLVNSNVEIWFGISSGMGAVVTIARPQNAAMWISVSEWVGLATTNSLDAARAADGDTNPVTAGSIATTNAHDLLVFAATTALPSTHGAPAPGSWTAMQGVSSATHTQSAWYRVVTAAGPQAPQVVQSGTAGWEAAVAAFRIAP